MFIFSEGFSNIENEKLDIIPNLQEELIDILACLKRIDMTQVKLTCIQENDVRVIGNTADAYVRIYYKTKSKDGRVFIDIVDVRENKTYNICRTPLDGGS